MFWEIVAMSQRYAACLKWVTANGTSNTGHQLKLFARKIIHRRDNRGLNHAQIHPLTFFPRRLSDHDRRFFGLCSFTSDRSNQHRPTNSKSDRKIAAPRSPANRATFSESAADIQSPSAARL